MKDPSDSARIFDAHWMLNLHASFPATLPFPATSYHLASFNFTGIKDAATAAGAVLEARRLLSDLLGVEFTGRKRRGAGSQEHYLYEARLPSGMDVSIIALGSVAPLLDSPAPRVLAEVA